MKHKFKIFFLLLIFLVLPLASAAHYVIGEVKDALDGTLADGKSVVSWRTAGGILDNITDIIGPTGNSGTNNYYMFDCELLGTACDIGDEIRVKVFNNGDGYVSEERSAIVTGAGFDAMPSLTLNSPPNVSLIFPGNNANTSHMLVNFTCSASDLDGDLANVTLYGNWTGIWKANETKTVSGNAYNINFTKNLSEGTYKWNCFVKDSLSIGTFAISNFSLTADHTPPNVSLINMNISRACGTSYNVRVSCNVDESITRIDKVIVRAARPSGTFTNYSTQFLSGITYYSDILLDEIGNWTFNCMANDSVGNLGNKSSENLTVFLQLPDLSISSGDINFSKISPVENEPIFVNAIIFNRGCGDANNFRVNFYEGDPDFGGNQIGEDITTSIASYSNTTVNVMWNSKIGNSRIFAYADSNGSLSELDENNNKANITINVTGWQEFYGNVTLDRLLGNSNVSKMGLWANASLLSGNIFVTDKNAVIGWLDLQALGRNKGGVGVSDDFSEIDSLLNMSNFNDSVSNVFTSDGATPNSVDSFTIYSKIIDNVPIVNSTNSSNFITGILWDTSGDNDGQYGLADKENIVFVTKVNKAKQGAYGIYDYEIRMPVRLREYHTQGVNEVYIYFDLN